MTTTSTKRSFDRSLVEGPLSPAIWKIVWPTLLQNLISGLQGLIDHVMVGHFVGFTANAAIGVSWQIFIVVVVFVGSLFSGMGVLVARFAGADQPEKVHKVVFQVFLASTFLGLAVFAPLGYFLAPGLLDLVRAEPAVQAEALPYLRILFAPSHLFGVFGIEDPGVLALGRQLLAYLAVSSLFVTAALSFTGALQGSGDTKSPFYISLFSQLVLPLGLCAVLDLVHGLEPGDIWLAIVLGHMSRCLLSVGRFLQGKWKEIEVSIGD